MSQTAVTVGQRYVSDTEPELGLGVVLQVSGGTVDIGFPAAEQRRTYSLKEAPLSRVRYAEGERVKHQAGQWLVVQQVIEQGGCLLYQAMSDDGEIVAIPEFELDSFVQFSKPRERLFSGQIDRSNHFALRFRSQNLRHQIESSDVFGLAGPKVSLLPHQLYIAEQVASRFAPRVLLADEVGLGKTIEAGLILHRQLLTGRTRRALVVVPPALLHQWLVEMLRRFNLSFTLLDEERCRALEGTDEEDVVDFELDDEQLLDRLEEDEVNPFESAQLVLCSLDFLTGNPQRLEQALAAEWDMLLVDEAHHLSWSPSRASDEYIAIEQLAERAKGLLLLTATPEQLGLESHFARLRLLDPDRYYDFEKFTAEQQSYKPLSDLVEQMLAQRPDDPAVAGSLAEPQWAALADYLDADAVTAARENAEQQSLAVAIDELVTILLDRHGTGRVLLRNTRHAVKGFPERHLHEHPIALEQDDAEALAERPLSSQLHPEYFWASEGDWWLRDPRVPWLKEFIKARRGQKILVICADGDTAQELEIYLRLRQGMATAVFHENMNLVARDRAAAYFADMEEGAQVLIASEIGSEGRNFQFAQDLVLFDLPLNPDLLEQRIGRLDRIGQAGEIHLHVPLYTAPDGLTAQEKLARWYHEGINAFTHTCAIGHAAFSRYGERLQQAMEAAGGDDLNVLVDETAAFAAQLNAELQAGRDRLLELNSCRPSVAAQLVEQLQQQDSGEVLPEFLMRVLDSFNVEYERHSENSWVLHPGEHMRVDPFPGLPESGLTITFDRQQALERDDISFATWEHPLVRGAMELILDTEFGNTAVATLKLPPLKPGTLMVEAVFCLHCPAPAQLQLTRYLQDAVMRVLLDVNGKNFAAVLSPDKLAKVVQKVPRATSQELVRHSRAQIATLLDSAEDIMAPERDTQVNAALASARQLLGAEIARLQDLAKVNPNVRQLEIDELQQQLDDTVKHLEQASLKLDAVRVIVAV
ncbi:RNA polymerase-associated protein RapA [uncultured Gilvimarinus sp.]|uniref:RNA polymerase-associated protein RapA n=1 Tax=uncultured Gilvimarinus sp. TaxID=1689143 RepID=UPI0030ED8998